MGDLVIKAAASNSLKIQSDNATNVLTVGTDDSVTLGTEFKVTSTSQTFTVKGIDAAITDSQTGTDPNVADSDSGQLAIYNGATKLWGITEHGYVVNPNIPAFHAYPSANTTANSVIQHNTTSLNNGNHFSTTTYSFTAPIHGIYHFYSMHNGHSGAPGYFYFRVNGTEVPAGRAYANDNDESPSIHLTQELYAGDYVDTYSLDSLAKSPWTNFGGYLIG